MSHSTNDLTPGAFAAASSYEEAGSPPPPNDAGGAPKGTPKDALDYAGLRVGPAPYTPVRHHSPQYNTQQVLGGTCCAVSCKM